MRQTNLSSPEIKYALEDSEKAIPCEFEVNSELFTGYVQLELKDHFFLVSDGLTNAAYVVYYKSIKSINTENQ